MCIWTSVKNLVCIFIPHFNFYFLFFHSAWNGIETNGVFCLVFTRRSPSKSRKWMEWMKNLKRCVCAYLSPCARSNNKIIIFIIPRVSCLKSRLRYVDCLLSVTFSKVSCKRSNSLSCSMRMHSNNATEMAIAITWNWMMSTMDDDDTKTFYTTSK